MKTTYSLSPLPCVFLASIGLTETVEEREQIEKLFKMLEAKSPTKSPLTQPSKADGIWSLEYTTSDSILGRGGYERIGPILQMIDTKNLKAENSESIGFFGLKIPRKVTAELTPMTKSKVGVLFKVFSEILSRSLFSSFTGQDTGQDTGWDTSRDTGWDSEA